MSYPGSTETFSLFMTQASTTLHSISMIAGIVICFFGYRYFRFTVCFAGFVVLGLIGYLIAREIEYLDEWSSVGVAVGSGIAGKIF